MHNEFTAILERDGDWYVAYCPEIPSPELTVKGAPRRKQVPAWPRRSP